MSTVDNLQIRLLKPEDAKGLAPLIAEYAQSIKRGVAQEADLFYTENLLSSGGGQEFLGAFIEGELKAFCLFHSMPDVVAGLISGQINHIYVQDAVRGFGLGEAMIDLVTEEAQKRSWTDLTILVPRTNEMMRRLAERVAAPAESARFVISLAAN